jgi:branched-chain amino acid transport system permease protein
VKVLRWNHAATGTVGISPIGVVILAFVPYYAGGPAEQPIIVACTFITMATMWNLLAGFSGLTSFGQHAYLGVGAYGLYVVAVHGINPFAGIALAALIAAVVSVPVSFLLLRLTGGYFAVASLVIASVFQIVATLSPSVGGSTGVTIPGLAGYGPLLREAMIYWAALATVVMAMVGVYLLVRGGFGLDARAAGNEPVAAASLGVRTGVVRRVAYLIAAAGAGAAGALLGLQTLYIEPATSFSLQYSVYMLFMVLVGGMGTIEGPRWPPRCCCRAESGAW